MKLDFGCSGSVRSSSKSGFCSINAFSCFHWLLFRTMPPSGSVDVVVLLSGLSRSIIMKSSPLVTRTACFSYFILSDIPFLSADSLCNSHGSLSVLLSTGWLSFVPGWSAVEGSVSFWTGEEDETDDDDEGLDSCVHKEGKTLGSSLKEAYPRMAARRSAEMAMTRSRTLTLVFEETGVNFGTCLFEGGRFFTYF